MGKRYINVNFVAAQCHIRPLPELHTGCGATAPKGEHPALVSATAAAGWMVSMTSRRAVHGGVFGKVSNGCSVGLR